MLNLQKFLLIMKNKFNFLLLFLLGSIICSFSQNSSNNAEGRDIKVNVPSLAGRKLYLGTYYDKNLIVADSCRIDGTGNGEFLNPKKYTNGVYFLVTPNLAKLNDFIIGNNQHFSIFADTLPNVPQTILGSEDNDLFKKYNDFIMVKGPQINEIERSYAEAGLFADSNDRRRNYALQMQQLDGEIRGFRDQIMRENPETFIAQLFNLMRKPDVPTTLPIVNGKPDSSYPYRYLKEHYWDDIYFNDPSLLHTPIVKDRTSMFEDKLDEYFDRVVSPDPDSVIKEIRYMMAFSRSNKEMYSFFLNKFTNKFWVPKYLGQDKIFAFLYENYFAQGDTILVTPESRKNVRENYYKIVGNIVGNPAAPMVLRDTADKKISLYDVKAPLIFIIFWDPSCGHCRTQVPRVDSFYEAVWRKKGVAVFTMNMNRNNDLGNWRSFINENNLKDWHNGYEPDADVMEEAKKGRNIRQSYNIHETPTFYLIDKDKKIIAKSPLILETFNDIIDLKYRQYQSQQNKK